MEAISPNMVMMLFETHLCLPLFSLRSLMNSNTLYVYALGFLKIYLFFNWRIIALQNFVVFCQTSTRISHAAAAAKSLQSCPTLCDPIDGSPPGSPSLGFSRQEHWSGLPFPSPMHESEKWKGSRSVVSDSSRSHGLQHTRLLCPWDFPGKSTEVGCHCLLHWALLLASNIAFDSLLPIISL